MGVIAGCILTLNQGIIMAAITNALADDAMQHIFSDGQMEPILRALMAKGSLGHLATGSTNLGTDARRGMKNK